MRAIPWLLSLSLLGCRPPPEAPAELEELTAWLFEKVRDGSDEELTVGVDNLDAWLDRHFDEATEGYTVDNLSEAVAGEADGRDPDLSDLVGASVATVLSGSLTEVERTHLLANQMKVFEGEYNSFDRTFDGDPSCFVDQECATEGARTQSVNNYPLGLELGVDFRTEWRWIEAADGPTVVYRTWLRRPADVNVDWLAVNYQYFVGVNMPHNGKTRRLQTTWIAASLGDTPVPEDMALNMVVDGMVGSDETLNEWLTGE